MNQGNLACSWVKDKNGNYIHDRNVVKMTMGSCECLDKKKEEIFYVKYEFGAFYLLPKNEDTIYDKEVSTVRAITLGDLCYRRDDKGCGYEYHLPRNRLDFIEIIAINMDHEQINKDLEDK